MQVPEELHCVLVMDQYLEGAVSHLLLTLDAPFYGLIASVHPPAHRQCTRAQRDWADRVLCFFAV